MGTAFKMLRIFVFAILTISSAIGRPWVEDSNSDGAAERYEVFVPDGQGAMTAQYMTLSEMRTFLGARLLDNEEEQQEQYLIPQETVGTEPEKQVPEEDFAVSFADPEAQLEEQQEPQDKGPFPVDVEEPVVQSDFDSTAESQDVQQETRDSLEPSSVDEAVGREGLTHETNESQEKTATTLKEEEEKLVQGEDYVSQVQDAASSIEVAEESSVTQQESPTSEEELVKHSNEEEVVEEYRDGRGVDISDDASSLYYQASSDESAGSQQSVTIQETDNKPVLVTFESVATDNKGLTATSEAQAKELEGLSTASNKLAWKIWNNIVSGRSVESNQVFSPLALTEALGIASLGTRGASADAVNSMLALDSVTSRNPHSYLRQTAGDLSSSDYFQSQIEHTVFLNDASNTAVDTYKARIKALYGAAITSSNEQLASANEDLSKSHAQLSKSEEFRLKPPMGILSTAKFNVNWPVKNHLHDELVFLNSYSDFTSRKITSAPAVSVDGNFYAGYYPEMDATAVALPLYPSQSGKEEQYFSLLPEGTTLEALDDAGHLSLMLIMPGEPGSQKSGGATLAALETKLAQDPENWSRLLKSLAKTSLNVQFPQMQSENALKFSRALAELPESQLAQLFDPEKADFSGVAGLKNLYLVDVIQLVQLNISSVAVKNDSEDRQRATPRQGDCYRNTKPRAGTSQTKKPASKSKPSVNTKTITTQRPKTRTTTRPSTKLSSAASKSSTNVAKSPAVKKTNTTTASNIKKVSQTSRQPAVKDQKKTPSSTSNSKISTTTPQKPQAANKRVVAASKPSSVNQNKKSSVAQTSVTATKGSSNKKNKKPTVATNSTARPAVQTQGTKPTSSNKRVSTTPRTAVKKPATATSNLKPLNGTQTANTKKPQPAKTTSTKNTSTKITTKPLFTKTQAKPAGSKASAAANKPKTTSNKSSNKQTAKVTLATNRKSDNTTNTKATAAANKAGTAQKNKASPNRKAATITKTSNNNKNTAAKTANKQNTKITNKQKNGRADDSYESLVFNRSFLYAVRHNPTGILMYIGRYVQP